MAIPAAATGYAGNAQNVFRVLFSRISTAPKYEAYDGAVFPAVGVAVTTANTIFAGTAGNGNIPMLSLVDTSTALPGAGWKPVGATGGSANPNRMKGQTNYVTSTVTPTAGTAIRFNMVLEVPSDATTGSTMAHDLLVRYTYTGTAPSLTWGLNEGTEGAPSWTVLTPGTHGIRHCRAGTIAGGPYLANIPAAGTEDSAAGWVTL